MENINVKSKQMNPTAEEAGPDIGTLRAVWRRAATAESQLCLIETLVKLNLAFTDIEIFLETQIGKLKSEKFKLKFSNPNSRNIPQSKSFMHFKLLDAKQEKREAAKAKTEKLKELNRECGSGSTKTKKILDRLRRERKVLESKLKKENEKKIAWLSGKSRKKKSDFDLPEDLSEYRRLDIFSKDFKGEKAHEKPEVPIVGNVSPPLDDDEISALQLPPKMALEEGLSVVNFKHEMSMMSTKIRWQIGREEQERLDDNEGEDKSSEGAEDEIEAGVRIPFDPLRKELDLRKRKVTDSRMNSKVFLPKPISIKEETKINLRESCYQKVFDDFVREKCDKSGRQPPNLSQQQMKGISKLKSRIKEGSVVVTETDKSGKLAVVDMMSYQEMGQEHIAGDREISEKEVNETERKMNAHCAMLLKVTKMGSNWQHEDRHRESNIKHSGYVAPMSLLVKDHKKVEEGKLPKTRPVVSASEGIGTSFSNILSEIVEPLADSLTDSMEVISTEDFISRIEETNESLAKISPDEVALVGADATAMFPSLGAERSARIVRNVMMESTLEVNGVDYKSAAMYVRYGYTDTEIGVFGLERVVPRRRFTGGAAPKITSKEATSADSEKASDKWIFPDIELTSVEKRKLIAACLEIGIRTSFKHSVYTFGGRYYMKQSGSPIGERISMAVARVVMYDWGKRMKETLHSAGIKIYLASFYVDDIRLLVSTIRRDQQWNEDTGCLETHQQKDEDITVIKHTAQELKKMMDRINPDLRFELELEEDFEDLKLPTLDTSIWIGRSKDLKLQIKYIFFEKPINSIYVIHEKSAMDNRVYKATTQHRLQQ